MVRAFTASAPSPRCLASYSALRSTGKPLHIFGEERAASDKERVAEAMLRDGRLQGNTQPFETEAVLLARVDRLLRTVLLLLATKRLAWRWDALDHSGEWLLSDLARPQPLASGDDPRVLVDVLVDVAVANGQPSNASERARRLLAESVRGVSHPFGDDVRRRLESLAEDPKRLLAFKPDESLDLLVRVLSHELLA